MKEKFVLWVSENPIWSGMILAIVIIGGLVLLGGCTTTPPATAPPITPQIKAKTSEINGEVIISNSTLAVYLVTVFDLCCPEKNIVFKEYVKPGTSKVFMLRAGFYKVCFKSSGIWGRIKCVDKIVEVGKEHKWQIKRK